MREDQERRRRQKATLSGPKVEEGPDYRNFHFMRHDIFLYKCKEEKNR